MVQTNNLWWIRIPLSIQSIEVGNGSDNNAQNSPLLTHTGRIGDQLVPKPLQAVPPKKTVCDTTSENIDNYIKSKCPHLVTKIQIFCTKVNFFI